MPALPILLSTEVLSATICVPTSGDVLPSVIAFVGDGNVGLFSPTGLLIGGVSPSLSLAPLRGDENIDRVDNNHEHAVNGVTRHLTDTTVMNDRYITVVVRCQN